MRGIERQIRLADLDSMRRPRPRLAPRRRGEGGFQLIELMVVLIIFGLTLAVALPNFTRRNSWERAQGYARELSSRMQSARQLAVTSRTPYRMILDRANRTYHFERQLGDSTWTRDPDQQFRIEGLMVMRTEVGGSESANEILFETRGTVRAEDSPAVVQFIDDRADTASVVLVRTGRVSVRMSATAD